jgi:hypothetical protein
MKKISIRRDSGSVDLSALNNFENLIGCKLPHSYKILLSVHNALYPTHPNFVFHDSTSGAINTRDISFLGFGDSIPDSRSIIYAQDHDVFGHSGIVPFGIAANGDYICFDYRHDFETEEPKVVVMFHDYPDDENKLVISFVSNSFDAFLDLLREVGRVESAPPEA